MGYSGDHFTYTTLQYCSSSIEILDNNILVLQLYFHYNGVVLCFYNKKLYEYIITVVLSVPLGYSI